MSPSLPAPPCSDALLWLGALALGGAIACATPVPAAPTTPLSEATATTATPSAPAKASPYAAAQDEDKPAILPVKALEGTKVPGSKKSSPYAAAKDEVSSSDDGLPGNDRFWALLIPIGVAAVLYGALRHQEGHGA